MEINESAFKPEHSSTQKYDAPPSTTVNQSATVSFAPYTLPSLKTLEPEEEEEETQPYQPDKSQEDLLGQEERITELKEEKPKVKANSGEDLKFDEWWKEGKEKDLGRKRVRSEETSPQVQEIKKTKTDSSSNRNNLISNNSCDKDNGYSNKRKATDSDENLFTLPPRARQREVSRKWEGQ